MPWFTPKEPPVKNTPWPIQPEVKITKQEKEEGFKKAFIPKKDGKK